MSRSQLQRHRAAIEEAVAAGTSFGNLARTYGVAKSTVWYFVNGGGPDRHNPLRRCQYDTLINQPRRTARARQETP